MKTALVALLAASLTQSATGGSVRDLPMDDGAMEEIRLAPGRSTVLRFLEKPLKVVLGNQDHYKAEFVENDVTLRPQGTFGTNLFVYTSGGATFGFLLKVPKEGGYDDLVKVRRREGRGRYRLDDPGKAKGGAATNRLAATVEGIERIEGGLLVVFLTITNKTGRSVNTQKIRAFVTKSGGKVFQKTVTTHPLIPLIFKEEEFLLLGRGRWPEGRSTPCSSWF